MTQYGSLMDPRATMLECLLSHEYTECYLYYSCYMDETDAHIKRVWEEHFRQEVAHLHAAADLLKKYEKKDWQQVIPDGAFPELLRLHENVAYIRGILSTQAGYTSRLENYLPEKELPNDSPFFTFQRALNTPTEQTPTHFVIADYIAAHGRDYRWQTAEHPVPELRDRMQDNVRVGRERMM